MKILPFIILSAISINSYASDSKIAVLYKQAGNSSQQITFDGKVEDGRQTYKKEQFPIAIERIVKTIRVSH